MCGTKGSLQTKLMCKTNKAAMLSMKKLVRWQRPFFRKDQKFFLPTNNYIGTFKELENTTTEDQLIDAHRDVFKRKNVRPQPKCV